MTHEMIKLTPTFSEPPPIITNFNVSVQNNSVSSRAVNLTWSVPEFYPESTHLTVEIMDTFKGGKIIVSINGMVFLVVGIYKCLEENGKFLPKWPLPSCADALML